VIVRRLDFLGDFVKVAYVLLVFAMVTDYVLYQQLHRSAMNVTATVDGQEVDASMILANRGIHA